MRLLRRGASVVLGVTALVLGLAAGHGLVRGYAVPDDRTAAAQVAWLVDGSEQRAQSMAGVFPEGREFTVVLTALAALDLAARGQGEEQVALDAAELALSVMSDPATHARFGVDEPAGGIFVAGWALQVAVARASLTGQPADVREAGERAVLIQRALEESLDAGSPFLESYPGQVWPVDTVVAVAALARLDHDRGAAARSTITRWHDAVAPWIDSTTGALPHRVDTGGSVLDGPRGTSAALMTVFWPDIDPAGAAARWGRFVEAFVVRRAGLVGVEEYPDGPRGAADVDSGPLVAGVSLSASAVALAAARRNGDAGLATSLHRQAEVLALPGEWGGRRRYAGGVLPVGDAFLAWGRSQPQGPPVAVGAPAAVLWPWSVAAVMASLLAAGVALLLARSAVAAHPLQLGLDDRVVELGEDG